MARASNRQTSRSAVARADLTQATLLSEPQGSARWPWRCAALLVFAAGAAVYVNTLDNAFVTWDDSAYLYNNDLVTGEGGFSAIWTNLLEEKPHKRNPLVFTTFRLEHALVGLSPRLYHFDQMVLHALNAVLLLLLFRSIGAGRWPSLFAALLFAVHPVNVESVAWVTQRKNTLHALFFLLSLIAYLSYRRRGGRWQYAIALGCFVLSLTSKSAAVSLAPVLLVTDRLLDRRWRWSSLTRVLPFLLIAGAWALLTIRIERLEAISGDPVSLALRPLIAVRAIAHYAQTFVAPYHLLPVYPRWPESLTDPPYWFAMAGVLVAIVSIILLRRRLGDLVLWALTASLLIVLPMLGLTHFNYHRYAFVADHHAYLSGALLFLAAGTMLERWRCRTSDGKARPAPPLRTWVLGLAAVIVLGACSWTTIKLNRTWKDGVTFWEHQLAGHADCHPAHLNLGNHYYRQQKYVRALAHYREVARLKPENFNGHLYAAHCCWSLRRVDESFAHYRDAVEAERRQIPGSFGVRLEFARRLAQAGHGREARNLCDAMLTSGVERTRDGAAVRTLRQRLSGP